MDIAIVSAGIRFPEASDLETFWHHIRTARDVSRAVSSARWPLDPKILEERTHDHIAHDRLYEVKDWRFDPKGTQLSIDPLALDGLDPLFHLALSVGCEAFQALRSPLDRRRAGVILGNIALPTAASALRAYQSVREALSSVRGELPAFAADPRNNLAAAMPARILADALGFGGPAFTLDAACASSLYAIKLAADYLKRGELDLVLAGGLSRPHSLYTQVGFSALQALSKHGRSRALDSAADGLMVGEGAGIFGLMRLSDAEARGEKIWAVIRGVGLSNDREGRLMAPSSEGQLRAMRAAYREAGWDEGAVELVECHATGTPIGDATELQSLLMLCAEAPGAVLSSVKPNVGHMLTAAGAASLAKVLMAFAAKELPPTANFEEAPSLLEGSNLRVLREAEPWPEPEANPRRAAISGFGFGGINAHLLLEEYRPSAPRPHLRSVASPKRRRVAVVRTALWGPESADARQLSDGSWAKAEFKIAHRQYRIPPLELREALPQQLLALDLLNRLALPSLPERVLEDMACLVGIELDPMTNLYACRWQLEADRPPSMRGARFQEWQNGLSPSLTANRVIGALGSIVASRIAREAHLGGPAFTVSSGAASGLDALKIAYESVSSGERSAALVLALDVLSSHRGRSQCGELSPVLGRSPPADSAAGLLLMAEEEALACGLPLVYFIDDAILSDAEEANDRYFRGAAAGLHALVATIGANEKDSFAAPASYYTIERSDFSLAPWLDANPLDKKSAPIPAARIDAASEPDEIVASAPSAPSSRVAAGSPVASGKPNQESLLQALFAAEQSHIDAHQEFLRYRLEGDALALDYFEHLRTAPRFEQNVARDRKPAPLFDHAACQEFARGLIAKVFGPDFAEVDSFPTRVRLPDDRLLLCHRVMEIEGEAKSLQAGRMVTEHDVHPDAWYLENQKMPTSIAVESGQADLMLAAYLGADFKTRGEAVYRLLDAKVCFYRPLPEVGETISYRIEIKRFFEQSGTLFFQFAFEASIGGEALMSMREGCAGFFSAEALEAGRGIKRSQLQLSVAEGAATGGFKPFVAELPRRLSDAQLDALRRGDYVSAFGQPFAHLSLAAGKGLPGGDMRLVHRIVSIEAEGGRFKRGRIVGEADIAGDDWFLTCHFVDDQVMPGTLMFECCLHTLRVFLASLGWVGEESDLQFEPLPGIWSQLKCRGQVLPQTKRVRYDIEVKEIGYRPEPYVICDALMSADGKDIVDITDMSLHLPGLDLAYFTALWASSAEVKPLKPAYTYEQILAFSSGKPSDCFGPIYRVFDGERKIARLPRPPFQFLDRIEWIEGPLMQQHVGTQLRAAYDMPADAWYWDAEGTDTLPLAVLVEIALQPCGFMAAYMGSALLSARDLSFRNLSGTARQLRVLRRTSGPLTIDVTCTKISRSGEMIIQDYMFSVQDARGPVYEGTTQFGFFSAEALAQQIGLRGVASWDQPLAIDRAYPPVPILARAPLLMVDKLAQEWAPAGRYERGVIYGEKRVDPSEWFFEAHFYEDPVMPGSLGLQALEQVLKAEAHRIWPEVQLWGLRLDREHRWTYRGQVLPRAERVQYAVHIKNLDLEGKSVTADAWLYCDGRPIYAFEDLSLEEWTSQ